MTRQIFCNAEIETLAAEHGDAVLVDRGRIIAVGAREQLLRQAGQGEIEEVNLDGAVLFPGFVDGHSHLELSCVTLDQQLQLHAPPITSITELLNAIAQHRRAQPHGWIVVRSSFGLERRLRERRLPEQRELDQISPNAPVVVLAGLHVAVLNTCAMRALHLDDEQNYRRGMTVHRHPDGRPNGVFTEVWDLLPTASEAEVCQAINRHARRLFSAHGITSVSTIPTSIADVRALQTLRTSQQLPFRVRFYPHMPRVGTLEALLSLGLVSGFGDHMLRFGGIKLFVDGEGGDGLGVSYHDLKWEPHELQTMVRRATEARVQLLMHAVTAGGIEAAMRAVSAQDTKMRQHLPAPHRIEHAGDYVPLVLIAELAAAGIGVVTTPHFASVDGAAADFQPLRSLVDAGVELIGATDSTGTVPEGASPLHNIAAMVNRVDERGDPSPHRLNVREAVSAFTIWSARGQGEGHRKGSLQPGAYADFVLLSNNPFRIDPEQLSQITVLRTYLGGSVV